MELDEQVHKRKAAAIDDLGPLQENFLVKTRDYKLQYAHLYFMRLMLMRPLVAEQAQRKWATLPQKPVKVEKVLEVQQGELSWITGTIYVEMKLKPNILNDITKDHWIATQPDKPKYTDDSDEVYLEDESGRIKLVGPKIDSDLFVTGVVISVLGSETVGGDFQVIDICYAGAGSQESAMDTDNTQDKYVALISGIRVGGPEINPLALDLLAEYLTGEAGGSMEQRENAKIVKVILAGDSIVVPEIIEDEAKTKKYGYDRTTFDLQPVTTLDNFLKDVCATMPVDIMPGESDPASATMPQQPIHSALLPNARQCSAFNSVTNPYWTCLDNRVFLGTAGQTINDIYKYVKTEERLEITKKTIVWRHMAPTAPDTLWCYPFKDRDPFIMTHAPHVYFVGNQEKYETAMVAGENGQTTRIIHLPPFSTTGTFALVNLRTLDCHPVTIQV